MINNRRQVQKYIFMISLVSMLCLLLITGCSRPQPPAQPGEEEPRAAGATQVEAVSQGDERGYARVILTRENDKLTAVEIVEYDGVGREKIYEDYHQRFPQLKEAHQQLAGSMVEQNTWDVDLVSCATATSEKVREAARFALEKASGAQVAQYFDGTFMGISDATEKGWGIAWVTLEGDQITGIRLEGTTPAEENGEEVC